MSLDGQQRAFAIILTDFSRLNRLYREGRALGKHYYDVNGKELHSPFELFTAYQRDGTVDIRPADPK